MIDRTLIDSLNEGDIVSLEHPDWKGNPIQGRVYDYGTGPSVGGYVLRWMGNSVTDYWYSGTIALIEKAPEPYYNNHSRTAPVEGDIAIDDDDLGQFVLTFDGEHWRRRGGGSTYNYAMKCAKTRTLIIDGETGKLALDTAVVAV